MVRLRFSSRLSSSLSSPDAGERRNRNNIESIPNFNDISINRGGAAQVPARAAAPTVATARAGLDGGDARENRPLSGRGSRESKGGRRGSAAAKKVLKLLDSPRKAIMGRTKSASSVGGGGGESSSAERSRQNLLALQGRAASGPAGLGLGGVAPALASSSPSPSSPAFGSTHASAHTHNSVSFSHRQVSPDFGGGVFRDGAVAAVGSSKFAVGHYDPFGQHAYYSEGFPVQQEMPFDPLNDGCTALAVDGVAGRFKDDGSPENNVLRWLHDVAPQDILPRVLSFAGSRKINSLSRVCKSWRAIALSDAVWRTACEDTGKWKAGRDSPLPAGMTWLQHYMDNPLVPVDYGTIEAAFRVGTYGRSGGDNADDPDGMSTPREDMDPHNMRPVVPEHRRSIRVLLRPGRYVVRESLIVHAVGKGGVTIETAEVPGDDNNRDLGDTTANRLLSKGSGASWGRQESHQLWWEDALLAEDDQADFPAAAGGEATALASRGTSYTTPSRLSRRATSLRNLLSCRSSAGSDVNLAASDSMGDASMQDTDAASRSMPNLPGYDLVAAHDGGERHSCSATSSRISRDQPRRAVIVLKTRKHNEPIVRVRQGTVRLRNIDLVHNSSGTDIWNGNSAVQVQPPFDEQDNPLVAESEGTQPSAVLDKVDIVSFSGRGVVNIDGGYSSVNDCYIHNCAATGIYVGGPGSVADVVRTDVVRNGNGNERSRRGIARGHSGVYLEQGVATLRDCNVSDNSLTGISAVSSDNATLTVEDTDLMSNGSIQLEMPPLGSASYRRSVSRNNSVSAGGRGRSRSGLMIPPPLFLRASEHGARGTPRRRRVFDDGSQLDASGNGRSRPQSPAEDGGTAVPAAAITTLAATTPTARRRMRFAALEEDNLAHAAAPATPVVVPMVE